MTQTRWSPTSCYIRHSQNFDKIDSFLKPVLNTCILGNIIVGWGVWVVKEGAGILHQIYKFSGGFNILGSRIHQSKSWYYLGPSKTSKAQSAFGYRPLTFFIKSSNLNRDLLQKTLLKNTFYVFLVKILYLEKKVRNIYTHILEFNFPREDVID